MTDSLAHMSIAVSAADLTTEEMGGGTESVQIPRGPAPITRSSHTAPSDSTHRESLSTLFPLETERARDFVVWRDTTSTAVFGAQSTTIAPARISSEAPLSLTDNAVFQGFVLLLAITYATLIYRNLGDIRTLLNRFSHDKAIGPRLCESQIGNSFSQFLNTASLIGLLYLGVATIKFGDLLLPTPLKETLPRNTILALSLLAPAAWGLMAIYKAIVTRLIGAATLSLPFIAQLTHLKRTYFALGVVFVSPLLLLLALCPYDTGGAWICSVAIGLIASVILYLRETLNLFLSKKVSILHWFLYLCTVEVFPISLLCLLAVR